MTPMKPSSLLPVLTGTLLLAFTPVLAANPDEIRADTEKLMERARQAKAEGRADEAEELVRKAKQLQGELREREGGEKRRPEIEKMERAKREMDELRKAGRVDEAASIERRMAERRFAELNERGAGKREGGEERMQHMRQAIEHVRAAGLPEVAEHLEQIAQRLAAGGSREGGSAAPENEQLKQAIQDLQGGLKGLHAEVQQLRHQLEESRAQAKKNSP